MFYFVTLKENRNDLTRAWTASLPDFAFYNTLALWKAFSRTGVHTWVCSLILGALSLTLCTHTHPYLKCWLHETSINILWKIPGKDTLQQNQYTESAGLGSSKVVFGCVSELFPLTRVQKQDIDL